MQKTFSENTVKWWLRGSTELLLRVPQVQMEANAELERPLSVHELYSAVQGMANGLAPGIDGIPMDFYKSF